MIQKSELKEDMFYKEKFSFSYSSLNKLLFSPKLFYKDYILKVNSSVKDLEDFLNSVPGGDEVKFDKFKVGDFIK